MIGGLLVENDGVIFNEKLGLVYISFKIIFLVIIIIIIKTLRPQVMLIGVSSFELRGLEFWFSSVNFLLRQ